MHRTMSLALLLLIPALLAGCTDGGDTDDPDDNPTNGENGSTNNTTTEPEQVTRAVGLSGAYPATIAYDPDTLSVPADSNVTVRFTNDELNPVPNHDWVLEGYEDEAATEVIENGDTDEVTFQAPPPGTYVFYCSVPGHRDNGMEGTFTVEDAAAEAEG